MRRLEEFQAAPLLERNPAIRELDLEVGRHVGGTKEDGDLTERRALLVQLEDAINDEFRLLLFIAGADEPGCFATDPCRPKILGKSFLGAADERIRNVENRLRRAVVLLQRHEVARRKLFREIENVALRRSAKRVDALRIVAHDRNVLVRPAHAAKNPRLELIGVLILVHEHVVIEGGDAVREWSRMLEHQGPED